MTSRRLEIAVDVSDLESEREHGYVVLPAVQSDDVVLSNGIVADGARKQRRHDSFRLRVAPGARIVARLGADAPVTVHLRVARQVVGNWTINSPIFEEHSLELAADARPGEAEVEVVADEGSFNAAHYWAYPAQQ